MTQLQHPLTRTLVIAAQRATVFRFFTDSERFARWWGPGSTIDCRQGGAVRIVYPNQVVALGKVVAVDPDRKITFTYGYEDPQRLVPIGGSLVTVELRDHRDGTELRLLHEFAETRARDAHVAGWRFQLALFANAVTKDQHAGVTAMVDRWFLAWNATDAAARTRELTACTVDDVRQQDAYANNIGRDELLGHMAMALLHMPGMTIARQGEVRQCQGTALVDWTVTDAQGAPRGKGTNVLTLAPDGRIATVVGFWG